MPERYFSRFFTSWLIFLFCFMPVVVSADDKTYTYDNLHRLKEIRYGDGTYMRYDYDELGNITGKTVIKKPSAYFTASPTTGGAPLIVNFTDRSGNLPTSWLWNFGDGTTSTEQNPTHTFSSVGSFSVTLRVSNMAGFDSIRSYVVTQTCPNPVRLAGGATPRYFSGLQAAYDAATSGNIIQCIGADITGNVNANKSISVTFDGGYDCTYKDITGNTKIRGSLTIGTGTGTTTVSNIEVN